MNTRRTKSVLLCNQRHRNVFLFQVLTEKLLQILGNARHPKPLDSCCSIIHRTSSKCEICARLRLNSDFNKILFEFWFRACNLRVPLSFIDIQVVSFLFFAGDDEWLCEAKVRLELEGSASLQEAQRFYDILIWMFYGKLMLMLGDLPRSHYSYAWQCAFHKKNIIDADRKRKRSRVMNVNRRLSLVRLDCGWTFLPRLKVDLMSVSGEMSWWKRVENRGNESRNETL